MQASVFGSVLPLQGGARPHHTSTSEGIVAPPQGETHAQLGLTGCAFPPHGGTHIHPSDCQLALASDGSVPMPQGGFTNDLIRQSYIRG
mgnify:CR=1 FL=1